MKLYVRPLSYQIPKPDYVQPMFNPSWLMHVDPFRLSPHRFDSHHCVGLKGVSRRGDEVGCVCILLPAHACVIIAERKQRVEKAHIKPSTVYLRSQ